MNLRVKQDLYRYIGTDSERLSQQFRYFLFVPGFTYIYFLRKTQSASFFLSRLFFQLFLKLLSYKYGIQIPYHTKIGAGFRISHFGTIIINPYAVIGKNFNIAPGCLIGNSHGKSDGVPTIGDNVCMNANSIVVGGVSIGNNVLIAPGAFVNFDVPDNCVVIGNPGKIIPKLESPTTKYIDFPIKL